MIVVLIIGLMVLVSSPFTSAWANSASTTKYEGEIAYAITLAKTVALRNQAGVDVDGQVTAVCISAVNNRLYVTEASAAVEADCGTSGTIIYQLDLPENLTVSKSDNSAFEMASGDGLCFNNRGLQVITTAADFCNDNTNSNLIVAVGDESAELQYY